MMLTIKDKTYAAEDLMSAWEACCNLMRDDDNFFAKEVEGYGICDYRTHFCEEIFPLIEIAYNSVEEDYDLAYDVVFVVDFLEHYAEVFQEKGKFDEEDALEVAQIMIAA